MERRLKSSIGLNKPASYGSTAGFGLLAKNGFCVAPTTDETVSPSKKRPAENMAVGAGTAAG